MHRALALAGLAGALVAACQAPPATGPRYFPLDLGRYWVYQGTDGGRAVTVGLEVVGVEGTGAAQRFRMRFAIRPAGDTGEFTVRWTGGFLEIEGTAGPERLLPERPEPGASWTWMSGTEARRGRVVEDAAVVRVPAGRYAGVLVIETGPADGSAPGRWHLVPEVGSVLQTLPDFRLELVATGVRTPGGTGG